MASIDQAQDEIVAEFAELGDPFDRYTLLIELAGMFEPISKCERDDALLVKGCQSKVWLTMKIDAEGAFWLGGDSNTFIIKGLLCLLQDVLNGQPASAVATAKLDFAQRAGIAAALGDSRRAGVASMLNTIRRFAAEGVAGGEGGVDER